jgi:hypothetical protein
MLSSDRYCLHQQYLSDAKNPHGYCPDHGAIAPSSDPSAGAFADVG